MITAQDQIKQLIKNKNLVLLHNVPLATCFLKAKCGKCDYHSRQECYYLRLFYDYFKPFNCSSCGRNAILFNPYNNVVSCHNCGEIWHDPNDKEKVMLS